MDDYIFSRPRRYELHDLHTYFNKILDAEGPRWPAIRDLKYSPHIWLWWIWRRLDRQDFPMRWEYIEYVSLMRYPKYQLAHLVEIPPGACYRSYH